MKTKDKTSAITTPSNSVFKFKNAYLKLIVGSLLVGLCLNYSNAQYSVGVGLVAGTSTGMNFKTNSEIIRPGIQLKFQYRIKDFMAVSPNITLFKKSEEDQFSFSYFETNLDLQWNVINNPQNRGYLILGPTYNRSSFVLPAMINGNDALIEGTMNRYGANLGFGVEQKTNFYQEFVVQYKSKLEGSGFREIQFLVKLGYQINMGRPKAEFVSGAEILNRQL